MPEYILHGLGTKVLKAELVAAFAGKELHRPAFIWGLTNKTPRFLALSPSGKVCATAVYCASRQPFCSTWAGKGAALASDCQAVASTSIFTQSTVAALLAHVRAMHIIRRVVYTLTAPM